MPEPAVMAEVPGNMRSAEDYQLAAELAIQFGLPTEASAIAQKGVDAKLLTDQRSQRLIGLAQANAAKDCDAAMQKAMPQEQLVKVWKTPQGIPQRISATCRVSTFWAVKKTAVKMMMSARQIMTVKR